MGKQRRAFSFVLLFFGGFLFVCFKLYSIMTWWQLPWEWEKIEQFFRVHEMKVCSVLQHNESCFIVTCVRAFGDASVEGSFLKDLCFQSRFELEGHDLGFELTKVTPCNKIQRQDEEFFRSGKQLKSKQQQRESERSKCQTSIALLTCILLRILS